MGRVTILFTKPYTVRLSLVSLSTEFFKSKNLGSIFPPPIFAKDQDFFEHEITKQKVMDQTDQYFEYLSNKIVVWYEKVFCHLLAIEKNRTDLQMESRRREK